MTICREWSLVKREPDAMELHLLYCRSWNCDICEPDRKRQVVATVLSGEPNRLLTLTVSPKIGGSPVARRKMLSHAWQVIQKRLFRRYGKENVAFFVVVEATQAGEPHMHVALRCPYVPQQLLSRWMDELLSAPIVDIRKIPNQKGVARYVAKYLGKEPQTFGSFKRYWHSKNWEVDQSAKPVKEKNPLITWTVDRRPRSEIYREWANLGWLFRPFPGIEMAAWRPPPRPPDARFGLPGNEVTA